MAQTSKKLRIRNWSEYNKALIKRGSITLWLSEESISMWCARKSGKRGRPLKYSDQAILCFLMLKAVYHLPFRALQGLLLSIISLLQLDLPVPCYTRICRRAAHLGQEIQKLSKKRPTDIVIDSSGLKVYGEGEWKIKKHGKSKNRTWRKIHLAVDPKGQEIILSYLGTNSEADCAVMPKMSTFLPKSVQNAFVDGAYDTDALYQASYKQGIRLIAPPRRGSIVHDVLKKPWMKNRNLALCVIEAFGNDDKARKTWKESSGYHKRSLAETAFYRWKSIFGERLMTRNLKNQRGEIYAKSIALNKMTRLGMPRRKRAFW
ncbi:MAG TPA: IS5 family transposase [Candidatus Nanoarchaeia archaeon]|nr:IS5 family transposase [Candidatus Nanoarchaeia archaeon]